MFRLFLADCQEEQPVIVGEMPLTRSVPAPRELADAGDSTQLSVNSPVFLRLGALRPGEFSGNVRYFGGHRALGEPGVVTI